MVENTISIDKTRSGIESEELWFLFQSLKPKMIVVPSMIKDGVLVVAVMEWAVDMFAIPGETE